MTVTSQIHDIDPVLVDVPMPIVTPRLVLRPLQVGDGAVLAQAKRDSWTELTHWMPWAQGRMEDIADREEEIFARKEVAEFILRTDLMLLAFDRENGSFVGSTGLHRMNWKARIFEIGYWVHSQKTGQGYATEITNSLLRYAFKELSANRVYISHDTENSASRRVIEKLGFIKEGQTYNSALRGDHLRGTMHYARYDVNDLPPLDVRWGVEP